MTPTVRAIRRWRDVLPTEAVVTGGVELEAALASTLRWPRKVVALLRPTTRSQVPALLRIAHDTGQPIYPYSRGANWGLGSRLPTSDGCALLDLSALDRIVGHDDELGTLTVEPGVHFAQASAWLARRGSPFYASTIGGPMYGSLIGNALDRGGGEGPLGDRAAHLAALEVVLGTGEVVHTGFDRFQPASCAGLSRTGVGPSLAELMAQSNFGVVTQATVWLARRPAHWRVLTASVRGLPELPALLDALRLLVQQQVLVPHNATLWNRYKLLAREGQFPWDTARPPLDLLQRDGGEPWLLSLQVEGATPALADAASAHAMATLQPHASELELIRDDEIPAAERAGLEPGHPSGYNVLSVYWRKRQPPPDVADVDPDRDRCGVVWCCPALPFSGRVAVPALAVLERCMHEHGFEPNVGLNPSSSRLLEVYAAIVYDRDAPGDDARALACHDHMLRELIAAGHLPYRLGVQSMHLLPPPRDDSKAVLARLKRAFDPRAVVAPGRYEA